jgi:hypothetical protein
LLFQEFQDAPAKRLRILEQETVAGVRLDDQRGIPDLLRHGVRIDRRHHDIVVPYQDQLFDFAQARQRRAVPL